MATSSATASSSSPGSSQSSTPSFTPVTSDVEAAQSPQVASDAPSTSSLPPDNKPKFELTEDQERYLRHLPLINVAYACKPALEAEKGEEGDALNRGGIVLGAAESAGLISILGTAVGIGTLGIL